MSNPLPEPFEKSDSEDNELKSHKMVTWSLAVIRPDPLHLSDID